MLKTSEARRPVREASALAYLTVFGSEKADVRDRRRYAARNLTTTCTIQIDIPVLACALHAHSMQQAGRGGDEALDRSGWELVC